MVVKQELIDKVKRYTPTLDEARLGKAVDFGEKAHGTQTRDSGDPYFEHPMAVADILADMELDEATIITALLHDTVEDTAVTSEEIEKEFGAEVSHLVDGVTKLTKIEFQPEHIRQAENFRKLLVAMSEDIRVLIVKLADRLHNMRTLHFVHSPEKRIRIAHETMEIYAPLAERIGIQKFKNELQDLAFKELHPDAHASIISRLEYLRQKGGHELIDKVVDQLRNTLVQSGLKDAIVFGREKTPCSIWRKMENKNISFEQLSDIIAFRIIVDSIEECYHALGAVHSAYHMIPDTFRDYISTPKTNGYQSLHTIVMGPEQQIIEIQIRTKQMHDIAEWGVAAHWTYKQGQDLGKDAPQYRWIRDLLYILENAAGPEEFLENTKLEMYYDQVFCFTPKGNLIALPRNSTTVDFAYAVHSDIGNTCSGAKVNGRIVPLRTILQNGDQVEIICSKSQVPSPTWEKFVVTAKAKSEIRRFIRAKQREEYINLGRAIMTKAMRQEGYELTNKMLEPALKIFHKKSVESLLASVGEGLLGREDVVKALFPNRQAEKKQKNPLAFFGLGAKKKENQKLQEDKDGPVLIQGLIPGMAVHLAGCCHPLPGDKIVGIVNTGKGVTIHTVDCETLENFAGTPERWLDVSWDRDSGDQGYIGRIKVVLSHEAGSLAELANTIAKDLGNIHNINIVHRNPDFFEIIVDVDVRGARHLTNIIANLRSKQCIHSVERYRH